MGKVPVGLLDQQEVQVLPLAAHHGELVLVAANAFDGSGQGVEGTRHTQVVEREIAEGDVLLELRRPRDPFTQALGEDHVVVGVPQ